MAREEGRVFVRGCCWGVLELVIGERWGVEVYLEDEDLEEEGYSSEVA